MMTVGRLEVTRNDGGRRFLDPYGPFVLDDETRRSCGLRCDSQNCVLPRRLRISIFDDFGGFRTAESVNPRYSLEESDSK